MIRKILALALLALLAVPAFATIRYVNNAVSVTETSQTLTMTTGTPGYKSVFVHNEGANEIFVCHFTNAQTPVACTTSTGVEIDSGSSLSVDHTASDEGTGYTALSIICSAGETATARVFAK